MEVDRYNSKCNEEADSLSWLMPFVETPSVSLQESDFQTIFCSDFNNSISNCLGLQVKCNAHLSNKHGSECKDTFSYLNINIRKEGSTDQTVLPVEVQLFQIILHGMDVHCI